MGVIYEGQHQTTLILYELSSHHIYTQKHDRIEKDCLRECKRMNEQFNCVRLLSYSCVYDDCNNCFRSQNEK